MARIRFGDCPHQRNSIFPGVVRVIARNLLSRQPRAIPGARVPTSALAATLTLLPAVLSLLGSRVNFLSIPFLARFSLKSPQTTEHGFWVAVTRVVTR